jgi:hypothetical protein
MQSTCGRVSAFYLNKSTIHTYRVDNDDFHTSVLCVSSVQLGSTMSGTHFLAHEQFVPQLQVQFISHPLLFPSRHFVKYLLYKAIYICAPCSFLTDFICSLKMADWWHGANALRADVPVLHMGYGCLPCQYHNTQQLKLWRRNNTQIKELSLFM